MIEIQSQTTPQLRARDAQITVLIFKPKTFIPTQKYSISKQNFSIKLIVNLV